MLACQAIPLANHLSCACLPLDLQTKGLKYAARLYLKLTACTLLGCHQEGSAYASAARPRKRLTDLMAKVSNKTNDHVGSKHCNVVFRRRCVQHAAQPASAIRSGCSAHYFISRFVSAINRALRTALCLIHGCFVLARRQYSSLTQRLAAWVRSPCKSMCWRATTDRKKPLAPMSPS